MWFLLFTVLVGALSPDETHRLVERYGKAQELVGAKDYNRAVAALSGLVRDYGSSEYGNEFRFALAETYFNMAEYNRALELFKQITDRAQHSYIAAEAMYGVAISSIVLGNFRQAQATLEKLAKQRGYDRDERTNFALGVLHYSLGEYEQAAAKLSDLSIPEAKLYLGKTYSALGKPLPALMKFKEVTSEVPNTPLATLAHFGAGLALFQNRDYDGARVKFQYFIENYPYSPLCDYAHYFLGCALVELREYAGAIDHLTALTRHHDNFLAAHANYFIGYSQMGLGNAAEAVERFQKVRANYPNTKIASYANLELSQAMLATADTAQTLLATSQLAQMFRTGELSGVGNYLSGVVQYQAGDCERAANQFEYVFVNYAETQLREPACAMLLLALNSSGQFEKCVAIGSKYVADYPNERSEWRCKTHYFLAEGYYHFQKYDEADQNYQQAYTLAVSSEIAPYARLGRCYCLFHTGRLTEAVSGFKGLLNAKTDDTLFTISAYIGYGYSLFNQKEYLKALDVFEALASTFPEEKVAAVPGHFYTGYCYYQLQYFGQAVDAWTMLMNKFPEGNPKVAEAAFRTGDTYFKALKYDEAVAAFRFVVERYPNSDFGPPAQALTAQCYYNRRQYLDAVREYQKYLDLYPADPQAPSVRKSLEMSYYLAGVEDSLTMEDFLRRFPQSEMAAEGQYRKGRMLFDAGSFSEAAIELQKAVVNFPGLAVAGDAQLLTAEAYAQLKSWAEAAKAYRKFLEYFPGHEQQAGAHFNMATAYFNLGDYEQSLASFQVVVDSFAKSEYAESARENIAICRKRLGAGVLEENPPESDSLGKPPEQPLTNEGGQQ